MFDRRKHQPLTFGVFVEVEPDKPTCLALCCASRSGFKPMLGAVEGI